ncbi:MAG TPA: oxygenase MpaB family protein, partial [Pseudonocardiaceae bacterium]|nr:oxygenase MpaB family protein [Pseudonocardiaceae bacterium]
MAVSGLAAVRQRLGDGLFGLVAGPNGPAVGARIHRTPGPRWFDEDRPIRLVHADASMFIGGLRALLLQSLHPLAMAAVAAHSGYRGDPWGRLQRTAAFIAVTTFGTATDAEAAIERIRAVHDRVHGTSPDGRPYRANDPHLLAWVHVAEVDSFLRCYQRYG